LLNAFERSQQKKREMIETKKAEKVAALSGKAQQYKEKEQQTLAMFAEMAKHHKLGGQQ